MTHSFRTRLAASVSVLIAFAPVAASALSIDELQAQIKDLLSQLQSLQQQLHQQTASTTPRADSIGSIGPKAAHPCLALARSLSRGMKGDDVREFQQQLIDDGDLDATAGATGFFGAMTEAAVHRMQARMGIASTTGSVGPLTRQMLARHCEDKMDRGVGSTTPGMMQPGEREMRPFMMGSSTGMMVGGRPGPDGGQGDGAGTISAVSESSITITDPAGVAKTAAITSTTVVKIWDEVSRAMTAGSVTSLTAGDKVVLHALRQNDGTFSAVLIQKGLPMPQTGRGPQMQGGFLRGGDNY